MKNTRAARKFLAERSVRGSPGASHTDENCVNVESLIRKDLRVKAREMHCKKQLCNTSYSFERNTTVKEYWVTIVI
jgi:hypothetical protein